VALRRRLSALLAAALIVAVVMLVAVPTQAQEKQRLIYTGTSTMTVQLVDVYGQPAGVETYQNPIEVVVRPGQVPPDPNPFFWQRSLSPS
jgi:hypothetical protein